LFHVQGFGSKAHACAGDAVVVVVVVVVAAAAVVALARDPGEDPSAYASEPLKVGGVLVLEFLPRALSLGS